MKKSIIEPERKTEVVGEVDILVAGGGISGFSAAIAAARCGAKTLLIERQGMLGGIATSALMTSMTNDITTGDGTLTIRGILEELLERLAAHGAVTGNWRSRETPQIIFDQEVFRLLLVEMVEEAGIEVLLETWVSDAVREGNKFEGAIVVNKSGRQAVLAKAVIDATGDADLAAWMGAPFDHKQPDSGSLLFQMRNADLDRTVSYFEQHPGEWQQYSDHVTTLEEFIDNWKHHGSFHLPHYGSQKMKLINDAVARGEYTRHRDLCRNIDVFGLFAVRQSGTVLINSCNFNFDHLDAKTLSRAELQARRLIPYIANFLIKNMPGFEKAFVSETASMVGVRRTRRIEADFTMTYKHIEDSARFDDVIGVMPRRLKHERGGSYFPKGTADIPFRIMIPRKTENLIVASGKNVCTEPRALIREQPFCFLLGQAAGTAAAAAADKGYGFRDMDIKDVQRELLRQNAYLGEKARIADLGLT